MISSVPRDIEIQSSTKDFAHQHQAMESAEQCLHGSIQARKAYTSDLSRQTH